MKKKYFKTTTLIFCLMWSMFSCYSTSDKDIFRPLIIDNSDEKNNVQKGQEKIVGSDRKIQYIDFTQLLGFVFLVICVKNITKDF